ncbi:2370_t:CDS:2, partial [Funneliformis caledonium]
MHVPLALSKFPGGMYEWFGEHWSALKARALEHLNITIRKFEDPLTTDIKKIMECCASYQYYETRKFVLGRMLDQPTECLYKQVMRCYFFVLDMFLRDPHVFVSKEGKKQNLSEMDYIVKIIGPILDIIFSDVQQLLQLKWIICREKNIELSHSECARMITRIKITKDRSKSLRTNKRVFDKYLINSLSEEAVEDSVVIGLQFAELYGQIIGIDLLDEGLYFGFEGPTFAFPNQLCNLSSLQETLE